jgi:2-polyprenyl-3-methyl-5-hydroxy-6-metoxy-1,4-benzoquinol methylase
LKYDPIKRSLGVVFNKSPRLRILFYHLLDLLLLRAWYIRRELRRWKAHRSPGGKCRILDAGSGFGQYTWYMSGMSRNCMIEAVDVKEDQIDDCNRFFSVTGRDNVLFQLGDLTEYKRDDTFDLILSVDVMEHIEDDEKVFRNFYDSLTQGGMLLISTPSDQGGSDTHDHDGESFIEEHVRNGYGIDEIRQKLARAGFSGSEAIYSYGRPGNIAWRLSMKYPILMLNFSKLLFILLPFYYLLAYPVAFLCNWIDLNTRHRSGTGLIVKAWK